MACMLYARINGTDIRLGRFKNREVAEERYRLWLNTLPTNTRFNIMPIYVETRKGKGKK